MAVRGRCIVRRGEVAWFAARLLYYYEDSNRFSQDRPCAVTSDPLTVRRRSRKAWDVLRFEGAGWTITELEARALCAKVRSTPKQMSPPASHWRFCTEPAHRLGIQAGRRNTVHLGDNRITVAYMRTAGSTDGVGVGGRRSADPPRPPPLRVFAAAFAERASVRDAGLLIVDLFGRPLSSR